MKRAKRDWNVEAEVLAEMRFPIPNLYRFHKKRSVDVEVDFLRFAYADLDDDNDDDDDDDDADDDDRESD